MPKRLRTNDELASLAQQLGADWRPGDNVMTWIRRHEATSHELTRLVRDGWSWADLGRALHLAGIHYQTGAAIPGDLLRKKAGKARADERKRLAHEALRRFPMGPIPPDQHAAPHAVSIQAEQGQVAQAASLPPAMEAISTGQVEVKSEFNFQPARLRHWSGHRITKKAEKAPGPSSPAQPQTGDADEVIARLYGRK